MAFIKNELNYKQRTYRTFLDAQKIFEDFNMNEIQRMEALNYILNHQEISYVLDMLFEKYGENPDIDHPLIDYSFSNFKVKPKREDDYLVILKILKSSNAYLRSKAITFLQDSGELAKAFISKLLKDLNRDIRIFAVNILGDVKYEDSRELLLNIVKNDEDINVVMSAVDYLGEIGESKDIEFLLDIKNKFPDEPYVDFGVDLVVSKIGV